MTDQELIAKCPHLLGQLKGAKGSSAEAQRKQELHFIRNERRVDDLLRMRAEWEFAPKRRGVSWHAFENEYKAKGPPGYALF